MRTGKLSAAQVHVLRMACTHGAVMQGCRSRSDHGGRLCTLASLRGLGLLDVMNVPTAAGRAALTTGRCPAPIPSVLARLRRQCADWQRARIQQVDQPA